MTDPSLLSVRILKRFTTRHHEFTLDVDFAASSGITVLFGPSGSGKTTILECIAGLLTPDSGRIAIKNNALFDSQSRANLAASARHLGYVFQTLALFPHLTVEENVSYGLAHLATNECNQRVSAILESFHIAHLAQQRPDRISGGERQRVALARSLVTNPSALLLDEPLSALDYETKSKLVADLRAWTRDHRIPVIYVTHALDEVFALADRVITLKDGRIAQQGTPADVLSKERQQLIIELQGSRREGDPHSGGAAL